MARVRLPARQHRSAVQDSTRWGRFEPRGDDIIISTPPKSGTTWTQGIVSSLLWPAGDAPGERNDRSPWIDARFAPLDTVLDQLDRQHHRRFIKTHSPADCAPIFEQCRYITVYRDGRDALMSWANHRANMRDDLIESLNASAAREGLRQLPIWDGDMDELFDQWEMNCSPIEHLASWWPMRGEEFVCFVHYNDLSADLDGEMRRIAEFLEIDVPADLWSETVDRCRLDRMRDEAAQSKRLNMIFEGGAESFFYKGTNGRWRDGLTEAQLERYDDMVADELVTDAAGWLEGGSLATGQRPDEL